MILTLLAAISVQSAEPVEVECEVIVGGVRSDGDRPHYFQIDCPNNAHEAYQLQTLANTTAENVDLGLSGRVRYETLPTVRFVHDGESWKAPAGQIVIMAWPLFPTELARYAKLFYCTYSVWPQSDGRAANEDVACIVGGDQRPSHVRLAERTTNLAIANSRWLPVDFDYCFQDDFTIEIEIRVRRGTNPIDGRELPDLSTLPQLCETRQ